MAAPTGVPDYQQAGIANHAQEMPEWEQYFREGVLSVWKQWTTVRLIIDQEWAGTYSRDKVNQLLTLVLDTMLDRRRAPMTLLVIGKGDLPQSDDVDRLGQLIHVKMNEFCNVQLDDNSEFEIAEKCIDMLDRCRGRDYSLAQKEIAAANQAARAPLGSSCRFQDQTLWEDATGNIAFAPEADTVVQQAGGFWENGEQQDDGDASSDDDMDVDTEPNHQIQSKIAESHQKVSSAPLPVIDEDGFEMVPGRRKR
ncbi:unnamed protein product [Amoebophrya sp. A25]|nr:unnamed protein product [Amoebophrya sp. A25]|eukprot:GSA25T00011272001.1